MQELGPLIKAAREQKAITIREAEELSGISNAYLSQIENGKINKPSPDMISKLSKLYQVPYEMLMEKAGYNLPDYGLVAGDDTDQPVSLLIVDDSPHDRELIRTHLENDHSHHYTIFEAETGTEALEQLSRHKPDCILLDYRLPDIDGLTVFEQIRSIDTAKDISVIILTGHGNEETAVRAMRMGAVNYMNKNLITLEKLVITIRHAVRRKKLRESLRQRRSGISSMKEIRKSINAIAAMMAGGIQKITEKSPDMQDDPDFKIIIKKTSELMELGSSGQSIPENGDYTTEGGINEHQSR